LKSSAPVRAGRDANLKFEVTDAQGQPSTDLQALSGNIGEVTMVDEALTTVLQPDIDHRDLQFSANFPKRGKYKVWFTFKYPDQLQQLAFVLEVW
jgi:hypothetical protein